MTAAIAAIMRLIVLYLARGTNYSSNSHRDAPPILQSQYQAIHKGFQVPARKHHSPLFHPRLRGSNLQRQNQALPVRHG